jgi:protoporphyrin/coproporphyrin ferrochelatase
MSFRAEPKTAVLLVNLGTPQAPTAAALRTYLAEFLSDPRVVEIPRAAWLPILHGIILRTRPRKSAAKYKSVWMPEGSPLAVWTARQAQALDAMLAERGHQVLVRWAMRYGQPAVGETLDALRAEGATRVLVLPLYPQYAAATTASVNDAVSAWAARARFVPEMRSVGSYHDDEGYVGALAESLTAHWAAKGRAERLLLSFHGVPARSLAMGDPYHCHCYKTARLLAQRLGLEPAQVQVSFQSRFGKAKWLEPYTEPTLVAWAQAGVRSVDVMCPGFAADCLETLEEIQLEVREAYLHAGGKDFRYVPCLNDSAPWIKALTQITEQHLAGWPTKPAAPAQAAATAATTASTATATTATTTAGAEAQLQRERALALGATD